MNNGDPGESGAKTPPTLSPVTYYNFVETHRRTLPSRIDKSIMTNLAGGDRPKMLGALRFSGLIAGPQDKPTPAFERLRDAGEDDVALKAAWARTLRDSYPAVFERLDLATATQGEIDELFRQEYSITGDTVRKAAAFFLALCRNADIPLSSYVKKTRQGTPGVARPRNTRGSRSSRGEKIQAVALAAGAPTVQPPAGSSAMVVKFKSGGSATLYVNADWVNISTADRDALLGWIDAMKDYAAKNPVTENQEPEAATSGS